MAGSPRKRDSKYAWLVCVCAAIANGMAHCIVFGFGVLLPIFMEEFNESRGRTALLGSLIYFLGCFLCPFAGKVCDRYGLRISLVIGTIVCASSLLISSWATGMTYLFISLCLVYGLGMSFIFTPCFLVVALYFDKKRGLAIGIVTAGASAGFFVIAPVVEALSNSFGWRNTLRIESGLMLSSAFLALLFDPNVTPLRDCTLKSNPVRCENRKNWPWKRLKTAMGFCGTSYILTCAAIFMTFFSHLSLPMHLARYCKEIGISGQKSSYLYLGIGLGSFVLRVGSGKLAQLVKPIYVFQVSGFISGISALVISTSKSYVFLVVITIVYGFADGALHTIFNCISLSGVEPEQRPYAFGCANAVLSVAILLGPMVTGRIADLHSYKEAFIITGVITIVGSLVPFFLCCTKKEKQIRTCEPMEQLLVFEKLSVV